MSRSVDDDIRDTRNLFKDIVWPEISDHFVSGKLVPVEDCDNYHANKLDAVTGVDFWVIEADEMAIVSIASRVQTGYDMTTHTVRFERESGADTEYQKRVYQVKNGFDYPSYTIQAYVEETLGVLQNAAWAKTGPLYEYLAKKDPEEDYGLLGVEGKYGEGSAKMFSVDWDELDRVLESDQFWIHNRKRAGLVKTQTVVGDWGL